ncbi:thrombospondin type 3 repeat-containing protein [Pseudomonadales bacterium]|nr:thrombospondin type 3 repeat-containing protein [Pseudomonadales bacterium]
MQKLWLFTLSGFLAACGGGGGASNSAPVLNNPGALSVLEGAQAVTTLTATDVDNDSLTYSIASSGDGGVFVISSTGALTFSQVPDFETAGDANADNEYELTVQVSDGALSASQSITVSVTDAFEGRVVDAPISGAAVFVDLNGNNEQDADEPSGVTDANGFFGVAQFVPTAGTAARVISKGGTDIKTGKALPDLALISDVPADLTKSANVTPLTTVIAAVSTPEEKAQVLAAMGITGTPEDLLTSDGWAGAESGDETALANQRVNQQIGLLLQTAASVTDDGDETTDISVALAQSVAKQVATVAQGQGTIDLTASETIQTLLTGAAQEATPTSVIDATVFSAVATSLATVNTVVADASLDPLSEAANDIVLSAQNTLQTSVAAVVAGEVSVDSFVTDTGAANLFENIVVAADAPDNDGDGISDALDPDDDNDGVRDSIDAFPLDKNETLDTDSDGVGNNADTDDDGDGVADTTDAFPLNKTETLDTDADGIGNNADTDDDGDSVLDTADAFPLNASESLDTDGDGIGNKADTDDDGDKVLDAADAFPLDKTEALDTDADGIGNNADTDDDGDSVLDTTDAFPLNASESLDTDGDGIGNKADTDDDGDKVLDTADAFPLNASESLDTDGDGVGNNTDTDDDNDGILDTKDTFPLVVNTQTKGAAGLEGFDIPEQVKVLETK